MGGLREGVLLLAPETDRGWVAVACHRHVNTGLQGLSQHAQVHALGLAQVRVAHENAENRVVTEREELRPPFKACRRDVTRNVARVAGVLHFERAAGIGAEAHSVYLRQLLVHRGREGVESLVGIERVLGQTLEFWVK